MRKRVKYERSVFPVEAHLAALSALAEVTRTENAHLAVLSASLPGGEWSFDSLDEWIAAYRSGPHSAYLHAYQGEGPLAMQLVAHAFSMTDSAHAGLEIDVRGPTAAAIERVHEAVARYAASSRLPDPPDPVPSAPPAPVIFIGHGRDPAWRDLKDHLADKHGYEVQAYETGSRAGHTIRDVLDSLSKSASFALLVMTAEDEAGDGELRARQNVIHEIGLFQGRLGWDRAIVLAERGVSEFSNLAGIQQLRFDKGRIQETFGDVLATLRREFGPPRA